MVACVLEQRSSYETTTRHYQANPKPCAAGSAVVWATGAKVCEIAPRAPIASPVAPRSASLAR